jgi:Transglycosylase SLT domain
MTTKFLWWLILPSISLFGATEEYVLNVASKTSSTPSTVLAVAKVESNLKDNQKSNYGALGLMQVVPSTARFIATKYNDMAWINRCSDKQLKYVLQHNNYVNIVVGSRVLEYYQNRYGYRNGISKYNACKTDRYLNKVIASL